MTVQTMNCSSPCAGCSGGHDICACHLPTKRAALLLNLGTPDSTNVRDVRRYLREFLSDPFVIDLTRKWDWLRPILATMIAHFRGPQSAEAYASIWWDEGSPLKVITERQCRALQRRLPSGWTVYYAMRYADPSVREVLTRIADDGVTDLVIVPIYPQWAGPTTGTALESLYREIARLGLRLNLTVRTDWYDDANYIDAQAQIVHAHAVERGLNPDNAFLLHSTHSMPEAYIKRGDPYEGHVRRTVELVNQRLGWPDHRSALSFQSKLGPVPWLSPSTETLVQQLAEQGETDILVCPISFTADCLETLEEIGGQYAELFAKQSAGGRLHLIPAPNDDHAFLDAMTHLVRRGPYRLRHDTTFESPLFGTAEDRTPLNELIDSLSIVGVSRAGALPPPDDQPTPFVDDSTFDAIKQPQHEMVDLLRNVGAADALASCWLVNTCQRYELYAVGSPGSDDATRRRQLLEHFDMGAARDCITVLHGRAAWRHLLRTAIGLNSQLPGDADVIRQITAARRMADHAGTSGAAASRLLDQVHRIAERIGEQTAWRDYAIEYCRAALEPLAGTLDLPDARMVVVGGSTTSTSLLRHLVHDHAVPTERLTVVYRGAGRRKLTRYLQQLVDGATHFAIDDYNAPEVLDAIGDADVLFLGIDRREPILTPEHLGGLRDFQSCPLTVIDFNSHGSTHALDTMPGVRVITAETLEHHVARHVARLRTAADFREAWCEAEAMIAAFVDDPVDGEPLSDNHTVTEPARSDDAVHSLPILDRDTFEKYTGLSLPRHVAYPMPTWWNDIKSDDAAALRQANRDRDAPRDLSLYVHLPFCEKLCKFCACNRTIMRRDGRSAPGRLERYLNALHEEITRRASDMGRDGARPVRQIHWGGGTPTYLTADAIAALHQHTCDAFTIAEDAEVSIEIDPRVTTQEQIETLRDVGFNRVSMGVQDFDPIVQEHVGRVQPYELVRESVELCRHAGFRSINFDLIYGLPYQAVDSVADTVERTIDLGADRIAFYHYAQIPDRIANQRKLDHQAMPDSRTKLDMFLGAIQRFENAGYIFVGLDHFARADEDLGRAVRDGRVHRNFQGMTTGAELDLVGVGCSAISCFPREAYLQNAREPDAYAEAIEAGRDPVIRGLSLSNDDAVRQAVLLRLYCDARLDAPAISRQLNIDFTDYFHDELDRLGTLEADGLVQLQPDGSVELTFPLGRVLMRNVAAVFDAYLDRRAYLAGQHQQFSTSA